MARLVIVMPTCAPESCVDSDRNAISTPWAPVSPSAASWSTLERSTVTNENSAATKTPQAAISSSDTASRIHAVIGRPGPADGPAGRPVVEEDDGAYEEGRPCAARASFGVRGR